MPAVINAKSIELERKNADFISDPKKFEKSKEAFLVQMDTKAIEEWNIRNTDSKTKKGITNSPFKDDKPGLYSAYGVIKQVDSYNGPALGLKKKSNCAYLPSSSIKFCFSHPISYIKAKFSYLDQSFLL